MSTPSVVARSACTTSTVPPLRRSSSAAPSISASLAAMIKSKLFFAHSLASSRPIPVEAPVTTASLRWLSDMGRLLHTGFEDNLDAAVLLVAESLVELRPLFERSRVSDDEGGIDVAVLDALQQLRQVVLDRRLRHPERQSSIDGRTHRNLVEETTIDANDGDGTKVAAAMNRLTQDMRTIRPHKS